MNTPPHEANDPLGLWEGWPLIMSLSCYKIIQVWRNHKKQSIPLGLFHLTPTFSYKAFSTTHLICYCTPVEKEIKVRQIQLSVLGCLGQTATNQLFPRRLAFKILDLSWALRKALFFNAFISGSLFLFLLYECHGTLQHLWLAYLSIAFLPSLRVQRTCRVWYPISSSHDMGYLLRSWG